MSQAQTDFKDEITKYHQSIENQTISKECDKDICQNDFKSW